MNEDHIFLVSLDEFCQKEQYDERQKELFRDTFSEIGSLVNQNGMEFISLAPYMNYVLDGLRSGKKKAHKLRTLKTALDYDFVCRVALKEWVPLSAAVLRNSAFSPNSVPDKDRADGLSELVSDIERIVKYFLDAQKMLLACYQLRVRSLKAERSKDPGLK